MISFSLIRFEHRSPNSASTAVEALSSVSPKATVSNSRPANIQSLDKFGLPIRAETTVSIINLPIHRAARGTPARRSRNTTVKTT